MARLADKVREIATVGEYKKLLIEKVFLPRGIKVGNANLYAKHMRLIMSNAHCLSRYLPPFTDQYITNLFVIWSAGFDAWSNSVRPIDKRGNDIDSKGNGHAAMHAVYDFTEERMQKVFDERCPW